ncbi:putative oligomerization/nucleic acid binding protein [Flavobacterium limicola]|uniref:Putative oligomerization/nucleic acid binding protein n=1 Tax=Flavobacterium limicola TaxID=180441 RepID=A0A495RYP0_9FLAO|nr:SHOCT domain-containing protein [Flavobacterium limicola]RKS92673.1 putative oligomerization/nucleic acid binding protein [Flavobacterium limicola]
MEHSIGVGAIVGLITASSLYVWNSNEFTKEQKTFLLIAIVFAPVQWIGILVIKYYNNHKFESSPERKTEKKLDSTISNLTELKSKGILSNEEYNSKVKKVKVEKTEQNLKNSLEYKQLKSLFDSEILTKEEFKNKIQLLQKVSEKEVNTKEINKKIDSTNKDYFEVVEEKEESLIPIYIGSILFFALVSWGILIYSNKTTSNSKDVFTPIAIDTSAVYNTNYQEPLKVKKYAYVVITVKYPILLTSQTGGSYDSDTSSFTPIIYYCDIAWENKDRITDIFEIEDYNEDVKYMHLDKAEKDVKNELFYLKDNFTASILRDCKNDDKREIIKGQNYKSEVTDRQIFTFDSYSEASINKEKINIKY